MDADSAFDQGLTQWRKIPREQCSNHWNWLEPVRELNSANGLSEV